MAAHAWEPHPDSETIRRPFERIRRCKNCGAEQTWTQDHEWMRVVRNYWYPPAGRCKPRSADKHDTEWHRLKGAQMSNRKIEIDVDIPAGHANKREALLSAIGTALMVDGVRIAAGEYTVTIGPRSEDKEFTYWIADRLDDHRAYSIREATRAECKQAVAELGPSMTASFGKPRKVTIRYTSLLDLIRGITGGGGSC